MSSDLYGKKIIKAAEYSTARNDSSKMITSSAYELLRSQKKDFKSKLDIKKMNDLETAFSELGDIIVAGKSEQLVMKQIELKNNNQNYKLEEFSYDLTLYGANKSDNLEKINQSNKNNSQNDFYIEKYNSVRSVCIKHGLLNKEDKQFKFGEMLEILKSGRREIKRKLTEIMEKQVTGDDLSLSNVRNKVLNASTLYTVSLLAKELNCDKSKINYEFLLEQKQYNVKKLDYLVSKYKYNEELLNGVNKIRKEKLVIERALSTEKCERSKSENFYDYVERAIKKPGMFNYREISIEISQQLHNSLPKIDKHCNTLQLIENHLKNIEKSRGIDLH